MYGKLALTPAQVNTNYIQCVKHNNNIQVIYKHTILRLTKLTILIHVKRSTSRYSNLGYISKGVISNLIQLEKDILEKWHTNKYPCFIITKELSKYANNMNKPFTKLLIEINGIWENRYQYGLIYNISNIEI